MARTLLLSGGGEYADPWHPFPETTEAIRRVLEPLVDVVEVRTDVDAALAGLDDSVRLVVVNIGNAGPGTPSGAARRGLLRHVDGGGGLLAVHASITAFPDWDDWESIIGGRWVRGVTHHPPKGLERVNVASAEHPITREVLDFEVDDERYTDLRWSPDIHILLTHDEGGSRHPLVWCRTRGEARVVYDALGHDADSYRSAGTRDLLSNAVAWILDGPSSSGQAS